MEDMTIEVQAGCSEIFESTSGSSTRLRPLPPSLEFRSGGGHAGRLGILKIALLENQTTDWSTQLEAVDGSPQVHYSDEFLPHPISEFKHESCAS